MGAVMANDGVRATKQITWEKDGAVMFLIPAGSFEMGDHFGNMGNALPVHTATLDTFYIDIYEVTVGQFNRFVNQSVHNDGGKWDKVAK